MPLWMVACPVLLVSGEVSHCPARDIGQAQTEGYFPTVRVAQCGGGEGEAVALDGAIDVEELERSYGFLQRTFPPDRRYRL